MAGTFFCIVSTRRQTRVVVERRRFPDQGRRRNTLEEARQRLENVGAQVRAADERNAQNKRDLEEIERRREDLRQQEERLGSLHDRTLSSLDQVLANGRQSNEPAGPTRISARDALSRVVADVDTMSLNEDEDAHKRLKERLLGIGDVIEQKLGQQETQFEQRLQEELTKRDQTWETRVAQVRAASPPGFPWIAAAIDERTTNYPDYGPESPGAHRKERERPIGCAAAGENYRRGPPGDWFLYNDAAEESAVRSNRWTSCKKLTQIRLTNGAPC